MPVTRISVRLLVLAILAVPVVVLATRPSHSLVQLQVTGGNIQPLPIAIPNFLAGGPDAPLGAEIAGVITGDLKRSGLFQPLDPASFTDPPKNTATVPNFGDWKVLNAQALVVGGVARQPDGRLRAEFRLWDVFAGQQIAGQQYYTKPENWRRVAHIIADAIYEQLTGEKGYFDTRIVFVDETGPKDRRIKRIAVMDQDGANIRYLTKGSDLVLTPRFNPTSQDIAYMSYGTGDQPRVYLMDVDTEKREL